MSTKRLGKEKAKITNNESPAWLKKLEVDDANLYDWSAVIVVDEGPLVNPNPAKTKGVAVNLKFPSEYPFKPPKICVKTKLFHPNVDDKGQICVQDLQSENWKPSKQVMDIFGSIKTMLEKPDPEHALNQKAAELYTCQYKEFKKCAAEAIEKHGEDVS